MVCEKKYDNNHLVHKNILPAIVRGNEPPTLRDVEPLTSSAARHPYDGAAARARCTCK